MPSFGTILTHGLALIIGAIAGGFIVKNNKDKAFAALNKLHDAAQAEIAKLRSK